MTVLPLTYKSVHPYKHRVKIGQRLSRLAYILYHLIGRSAFMLRVCNDFCTQKCQIYVYTCRSLNRGVDRGLYKLMKAAQVLSYAVHDIFLIAHSSRGLTISYISEAFQVDKTFCVCCG